MSQRDFDVDTLASYLHLTPPQVSRMADRGKLPGRKIGGQWRFPEAEIHHWLEERIGVSGDVELAQVENVLDRASPDEEEICIAEMLPREAITVPLNARSRGKVITAMTELAANTGWLWDPERMAEAVSARESLHSTALENGVALLHPRRPQPAILAQAFLALGRTFRGIPFGDSQGRLTDVFFLICSTDDGGHLRTLARLSRLLAEPSFLDNIRQADDPEAVHKVIVETEKALFG